MGEGCCSWYHQWKDPYKAAWKKYKKNNPNANHDPLAAATSDEKKVPKRFMKASRDAYPPTMTGTQLKEQQMSNYIAGARRDLRREQKKKHEDEVNARFRARTVEWVSRERADRYPEEKHKATYNFWRG